MKQVTFERCIQVIPVLFSKIASKLTTVSGFHSSTSKWWQSQENGQITLVVTSRGYIVQTLHKHQTTSSLL